MRTRSTHHWRNEQLVEALQPVAQHSARPTERLARAAASAAWPLPAVAALRAARAWRGGGAAAAPGGHALQPLQARPLAWRPVVTCAAIGQPCVSRALRGVPRAPIHPIPRSRGPATQRRHSHWGPTRGWAHKNEAARGGGRG